MKRANEMRARAARRRTRRELERRRSRPGRAIQSRFYNTEARLERRSARLRGRGLDVRVPDPFMLWG